MAEGTKVDLYIGHANYKLYENVKDPNWAQESVLTDQMAYTNTLQNVRGSVFFRLGYLAENSGEFSGSGLENLRKNNEHIKNHFSPDGCGACEPESPGNYAGRAKRGQSKK